MKNFITLLSLAVSTIMVNAQEIKNEMQKMSPEKLWELGRVSLDHTSNGYALYGVTHYNLDENVGSRDLFLVDVHNDKISRLTNSSNSKQSGFLIRGGRSYCYIEKGQLYIATVNPSKTELPRKLTSIKGGINNAKIKELNDGRLILTFSCRVKIDQSPLERHPDKPKAEYSVHDDLMYRHWDKWTDYSYNHIVFSLIDPNNKTPTSKYTDIMEGERFHSPMPPFGGSESFDISHDGRFIVYASKKLIGKDFTIHTDSKLYL